MAKSKGNPFPRLFVNVTLVVICLLWLIPTLGLFVSSFRPRDEIMSSGWWTVLPHCGPGRTSSSRCAHPAATKWC